MNVTLVSKSFDELTREELYEILRLRTEVFVLEQNCICQDMDRVDYRSRHVFLKNADDENGEVLACLRLYTRNTDKGEMQIGRVVTKTHGLGHGRIIMKQGINDAFSIYGAKEIALSAQCQAIGFYKNFGFEVSSSEYIEDGIPHVQMRLALDNKV